MPIEMIIDPDKFLQEILKHLPLDTSTIDDVVGFVQKHKWDNPNKPITAYSVKDLVVPIAEYLESYKPTQASSDNYDKYIVCHVPIPLDMSYIKSLPLLKAIYTWFTSKAVRSTYHIVFLFENDKLVKLGVFQENIG
jgi:hypothetical protein